MRERWAWFSSRRTVFFEIWLLLVTAGWAADLLVTDVFAGNVIYDGLSRVASQNVWAALLLWWLVAYGIAFWRMSLSGRVACLCLIAGWWMYVAAMIFAVSPSSTGVVAYGAAAIVTAVGAWFNARKINNDG